MTFSRGGTLKTGNAMPGKGQLGGLEEMMGWTGGRHMHDDERERGAKPRGSADTLDFARGEGERERERKINICVIRENKSLS